MMYSFVISVTEMLQLAAIGSCISMIGYLIIAIRQKSLALLPVLYFIYLTSTFLIPVLRVIPEIDVQTLRIADLNLEHIGPIISFLFILQLILRKPPHIIYWLLFALPLVGGGPLLYLSIEQQMVCMSSDICIPPEKALTLYRIVGTAIVFMLLVVSLRRIPATSKKNASSRHTYWLIIMLICYNLMFAALDLSLLAELVNERTVHMFKVMVGITFIYLVFISIYQVFGHNFYTTKTQQAMLTAYDKALLEDIQQLLEKDKIYRQLEFNRANLADMLHLTEQHLSRIINLGFGRTFTELVNDYRVEEAKQVLRDTTLPMTTISFDVGFRSITTFNRVFKECTGMSPSEYRTAQEVMADNI